MAKMLFSILSSSEQVVPHISFGTSKIPSFGDCPPLPLLFHAGLIHSQGFSWFLDLLVDQMGAHKVEGIPEHLLTIMFSPSPLFHSYIQTRWACLAISPPRAPQIRCAMMNLFPWLPVWHLLPAYEHTITTAIERRLI